MAKTKIVSHFKVQVFLKSGGALSGTSAYQPMLMQHRYSDQQEYQPSYFAFTMKGHPGITISVPMESVNYIFSKPVYEDESNVST